MGIGRTVAQAFAREGARVVVAGRRVEAAEQTVQLIRDLGGDALKQGGAIIDSASILGTVGMPGTTIYAATKGGIVGMTRAAAIEYAKAGVRINVISPGTIETDMLDRFAGGDAAAKAQFGAGNPLARTGRPQEIAEAVIRTLRGSHPGARLALRPKARLRTGFPTKRAGSEMTKTKLSLFYLGSYLLLIGLGLLFVPHGTLKILQSNRHYDDVFVRVAGMLMSGLGLSIFGMIRAHSSHQYPATLFMRVYFISCFVTFYATTHDSLFLVLVGIVGIGFVLTLTSYLLD
jgi:hypothetical protein